MAATVSRTSTSSLYSLETASRNASKICALRPRTDACATRVSEKGPKPDAKKILCVRDAMNRSSSEFTNGTIFRQTGRTCADVRCTKAGEPCAYVVIREGVPSLCMVPLPEEKRVGREWTEVEYWVRE